MMQLTSREEYMFCASRINFSEPEMLDSEVSFLREEFSFLRSNYSFSRSDRCQASQFLGGPLKIAGRRPAIFQ